MNRQPISRDNRRVLILDFDFFTAIGGGQVLYRRIVERNPVTEFYWPSRGSDYRMKKAGKLPANGHPFLFGWQDDPKAPFGAGDGSHWLLRHHAAELSRVASAIQGMTFQAVDLPSFFPAGGLLRPILAAYGVMVERVALGMVGWLSVSLKNSYTPEDQDTLKYLMKAEAATVESADVRYTISHSERCLDFGARLPAIVLDMHDTVESFPVPHRLPPGSGLPELWYVGRLDGAKGPDLFLEMASRVPRHLFGMCYFAGPDNTWESGQRWSDRLLNLAKKRGLTASYEGRPSDLEIRRRVYSGRTVLVVPSRNDAFNYVSLEAILNGCPILLSERTGACEFLRAQHPNLLPRTMDPDRMEEAVEDLREILENYEENARSLREELITRPFPRPRAGFMNEVYETCAARAPERDEIVNRETAEWRNLRVLSSPVARDWRPRRVSGEPKATVVIPTLDRPELLGPTLACLTRQTFPHIEVVVIDDGSARGGEVREVAEAFAPLVRLIRRGNAGEAAAVNRGIEAARGKYVGFLSDDDAYAPELIAEAVAALERDSEAIGAYPDWDIVDASGHFVEAHRLPDFDRDVMMAAHWCLPGPGVIVRKSVLEKVGGRDLSFRYVSDFDLWLRTTKFGPMVHLPRKLAYWRLHSSNLTTSDRRMQMAAERIALVEKLFQDPEEDRARMYGKTLAAANLAAAAILGRAEPAEAMKHIRKAHELAPELLRSLPPNMASYPLVWPAEAAEITG